MRTIAALLILLAACGSPSVSRQGKQAFDAAVKTANGILGDKVERLSVQYSISKETSDNVAHAVIAECSREIAEAVNAEVDRFRLEVTGTKNQRTIALMNFQRDKEISIRQQAWSSSVASVMKGRSEKAATGKE